MTNYDAALSGAAYLRLTVTESSQNLATNQSTDAWSLTLYKGSFASFDFSGIAYSVSINGSIVSSGTYTFDFSGAATSKLIASGSTPVTHDADGQKTTAVSGYTADTGTSTGGPATASGSFVQTRIPRGPKVEVSGAWQQSIAYVEQAGVWQTALVYVEQSGAWVQAT